MMQKGLFFMGCVFASMTFGGVDYPFKPAPLKRVTVNGGFWLSRFETNRLVTVWTDFQKSEETGRIGNFARAGKLEEGPFRGIPFDDSDVFKIVEGAAYTLATHPDAKLEKYLDDLIAKMAAAQEPDGYLYTARTLGFKTGMMGSERWSNLVSSHELYNVGHMYEAAVAYYEATGKRSLLEVAIKNADLIDKVFGPNPGQLVDVPGHEEIEIGLCKLYRVTGEERYLKLARFFVDMRGRSDLRKRIYGVNVQDHLPALKQDEAVGHAVRAAYLYAGMADIAALTGDNAYIKAIDRLWQNVVERKLHLSGGIGARHGSEAFGDGYELPNASAYLETCAAIANALWNQRMFLLHGDAKYIDVLERTLYNGFLSGISLSGDEFFYPNPLASSGGYKRSKWFSCSCCPVNIVRFIPQIAQFCYAQQGDDIYVNLFAATTAELENSCGKISIAQQTDYPWSGEVRIEINPAKDTAEFPLKIRIPGWAIGQPVPSDLYEQTQPATLEQVKVAVNGKSIALVLERGYLTIKRNWRKGDVVSLALEMPVKRISCFPVAIDNRGRLAVERGPLIYCAEGIDNDGRALNLVMAPDAPFTTGWIEILGQKFVSLSAPAATVMQDLRGRRTTNPVNAVLVPYFAWCHRGTGEMQVWFPFDTEKCDADSSVRASASHCNEQDSLAAVFDRKLPKNSGDNDVPRMTWWPHKGGTEWLQADFGARETIAGCEVYWFDDTGKGQCRLPAAWIAQEPDDSGGWRDVPGVYPVQRDRFSTAVFTAPITTDKLRIKVNLQNDFSAGVLQWHFNLKNE